MKNELHPASAPVPAPRPAVAGGRADDAVPASVGVVGLGRLGGAIGQLVAEAGLGLLVAERPGDPMFDLVVGAMLPDAEVVPLPELLARADVVVLAVPQAALDGLDLGGARGVVVDATNAWGGAAAGADGVDPAWWALRVPGVPVVKSLNHLAYTELLADARPAGSLGRRAVAVAGDDAAAVARVGRLVDALGFDPVPAPSAAAGLLEPDGELFGARRDAAGMRAVLERAGLG